MTADILHSYSWDKVPCKYWHRTLGRMHELNKGSGPYNARCVDVHLEDELPGL